MLERIHQIKGVGLFNDANGQQHTFKKASLIYADNGMGKSTLASVFRSCASNDPHLIARRRTIDGNHEPTVLFQFSNGQRSEFINSSWNAPHPELLVFDADFVEENVYAGGLITTDQRKNLLLFALGTNAVNAQREYDQADNDALAASQLVRDLKNQLSGFHSSILLQQFRELPEVQDADAQIINLRERIVEAQNIEQIQAKALPQRLDAPPFEVNEIFETLERSLSNIDLDAEQRVKQHLDLHDKPNHERWISDGHSYEDDERCPYCNQSLDGVDLIQAYRSYFNQDYNQLKASVADLGRQIEACTTEAIAERLQASFANASAIIDGWRGHVDAPPSEFDRDTAKQALDKIRKRLNILRRSKEANLLESVGSGEARNELLGIWDELLGTVNSCNDSIDNAVGLITAYKSSLAAVNLNDLQQTIADINLAKTRYRQDVVDLIEQLDVAIARETATKAEKQTKKNALNAIMQTTLASYKDRINQLLSAFGAQFSIPNINVDYRGGLRSDYQFLMRGSDIKLTGSGPDFKTSLSESDKRTLAFAFFIASVESDTLVVQKTFASLK